MDCSLSKTSPDALPESVQLWGSSRKAQRRPAIYIYDLPPVCPRHPRPVVDPVVPKSRGGSNASRRFVRMRFIYLVTRGELGVSLEVKGIPVPSVE